MVSAGENARPQDMARGIDTTVSDVESAEDSPSRAAPDRALDSNAILSPVAGRLMNLEATGDPVFASRALGEGVGVVVVTVVNAAELTVVTPLIGDGSGDNNGGDCKTVSAGSPIIDVEQ